MVKLLLLDSDVIIEQIDTGIQKHGCDKSPNNFD